MSITAKVVVSRHAVDRLKERFYFRFRNYFGNYKMTESLIVAQVSNGVVLQSWKEVPFYVNKMKSMHGKDFEIVKKSGVYFICAISDNTIFVKTCVEKILNYR